MPLGQREIQFGHEPCASVGTSSHCLSMYSAKRASRKWSVAGGIGFGFGIICGFSHRDQRLGGSIHNRGIEEIGVQKLQDSGC